MDLLIALQYTIQYNLIQAFVWLALLRYCTVINTTYRAPDLSRYEAINTMHIFESLCNAPPLVSLIRYPWLGTEVSIK